jgi:asparagine synthase (glutamine-hydrolysing)
MARQLRGSFVLLIFTPKSLHVITDRIASRKIFRWEHPSGIWLDTDLAAFTDCPADPAGVASLIINRFTYGGRTILSGVISLPRAQVHSYDGKYWSSTEYWRYDFAASEAAGFERDITARRRELWQLILQAIKRRIPDRGSVIVSLSGGVDSRAILAGLLASGLKPDRLQTASYGSAEDDDAVVASELAGQCGSPWRLVPGSEDPMRLLQLNGVYCGGQVFFYPRGLDGFPDFVASLASPVTAFVGDECYGWNDMTLNSWDDTLSKGIGIRSPAKIPAYYSYGSHSQRSIECSLQEDIASLRRRFDHVTSFHDLKDVLYLDQRLSNMLLPWREQHTGRFARVVNPHVDEDILDYMKQVPTAYRLDKRLFRETVTENLGSLVHIRYARAGGCSNEWLDGLFLKHLSSLEDFALGYESRLDEVIPPELILAGLAGMRADLRLKRITMPRTLTKLALKAEGIMIRNRLAHDLRRKSSSSGYFGFPSMPPIQMATVLQLRYFLRK